MNDDSTAATLTTEVETEPCARCQELQTRWNNVFNEYRRAFAARKWAVTAGESHRFRETGDRLTGAQRLVRGASLQLQRHRATHLSLRPESSPA